MTAPTGLTKICVICGDDCANKPRTKDAHGTYYCKACHEHALHRGAAVDVSMIDRALEGIVPPPVIPSACPNCGRAMAAGAVLCTNCGYDIQAGYRMPPPSRLNAAVQKSAPWFLSPVYLFIKPATFFRNFVNSPPLLTAMFFWIFGMAGVIGQVETRMAMAQISGRANPVHEHWGIFWTLALLGGMVAGAFTYAIGGWWYRVRLGWSGHRNAEPKLVRRVYILASMVYAIPVIVSAAVNTARYDTPTAAAQGSFGVLDIVVLICVFWSVWNSFVGVRTVFETKLVRSIIWFLVLPAATYLLTIAGAASVTLFAAMAAPDLNQPRKFESQSFMLLHPGNWEVDRNDPDFDPDSCLFIGPRFQYASMQINLYESDLDAETELKTSLQQYQIATPLVLLGAAFDSWGSHRGHGQALRVKDEGEQYVMRVFVAPLGQKRFLEVHEIMREADANRIEPGFMLIRATLKVR